MGVYVNLTYLLVFFYRGENPAFLEHNYIWFLCTYTLLFARLTVIYSFINHIQKALMVNHCAKENYSMIQWPVFGFLLIMNVYTYTINFVPSLCSELGVNTFWLLMFGGFGLCNILYA
jgi:hypothetical protein